MATLYITEYAAPGRSGGLFPLAMEPANTIQTVSYTGTAGQSAAFKTNTTFVRIHTDGICSILFGTNPTATTSHSRMVAGQTEYFAVPSNLSYKVSAVVNT